MKEFPLNICSKAAISFSIIAAVFMLGCEKTEKNQSTISVFGTGTVLAQPDIIQMRITLSNVARTTKMAQNEVSKMVRQAVAIIKDAGVEDKNIMTASLNFRSEYEYTASRRVLIGQRAEQGIVFSVDSINNNSERVSEIIDRLIQINGIELNQINFSVKNNTDYFFRSRELAFQKAVEKAEQYAKLSNLKIIRVLNISEDVNQQALPINNKFMNQSMDYITEASSRAMAAIVPVGELEITSRVFVEFILE